MEALTSDLADNFNGAPNKMLHLNMQKPVSIAVVSIILHHAHSSNDMDDNMLAIANVTCIGFFLYQRGEHSLSTNNTHFCLQDMTPHRGANVLTYETTGAAELDNATSVALTFTTQKNGVKGVNNFAEQMFKAGNFSFLSEIYNDGAPTYDNPDPNNLP